MCGRYVITSPPDAIRALFGYDERPNFPPRYNVAPTQPIPTVRLADGKRTFVLMRWGFIPAWVDDPKTLSLLINARGESVLDKPAFRNAMRRRRCLLPADGFYDWRAGEPKRPYFVRAKSGAPLAFAGLWETWTGPNGEAVDTRCDRHHALDPCACRHSRARAGDRGARSAARTLRSLAGREPRGERFGGAYRAGIGGCGHGIVHTGIGAGKAEAAGRSAFVVLGIGR